MWSSGTYNYTYNFIGRIASAWVFPRYTGSSSRPSCLPIWSQRLAQIPQRMIPLFGKWYRTALKPVWPTLSRRNIQRPNASRRQISSVYAGAKRPVDSHWGRQPWAVPMLCVMTILRKAPAFIESVTLSLAPSQRLTPQSRRRHFQKRPRVRLM